MAFKRNSISFIEQEFDRLFNDLLIDRWRAPRSVRNYGDALVVEDEDSYHVRVAAPEASPNELAVEVSEWRLALRIPTAQGVKESTLDTDAVFSKYLRSIERVIEAVDAL